jgi:hypothetical protein
MIASVSYVIQEAPVNVIGATALFRPMSIFSAKIRTALIYEYTA